MLKIKAAYYPKGMPTKIVVQRPDGNYYATDLSPYREVKEEELEFLAYWRPTMGFAMPSYVKSYYFFLPEVIPND